MPDLLLELFCEEIPARMQKKAAEDLRKLVTDALVDAGLVYEGAKAFATPRRLALTVHELPARSPDSREEKKGPRVGAPEKAVEGFLKAAGLTSIDQAKVQPDKKGDFYVAVVEKPGRPAQDVIAEIVPAVIRSFPWPKSMRWGERSKEPGSLTWVRPLHSILCTFGPETEEPEIVAFAVDGIRSGNATFGHRFMAPGAITVRRFDDYAHKLEAAKVVLDAERRKDIILHAARDQALALGLELVEDDALADEVSGLVEWPVVLAGSFDKDFLDLPPEVIRTTIRNNQKCFVLQEARSAVGATGNANQETRSAAGATGNANQEARSAGGATGTQERNENKLAPKFVLVANIEASDSGKAIIAGNERVIRARLADARHFWKTDLAPLPDYRDKAAKPLDQRLEKLKAQNIVFHEKLGTQGERVERIMALAKVLGEQLEKQQHDQILAEYSGSSGQFHNDVQRAAYLAKADLVTEMVGEFPELQGLMGKYYALRQGEASSVAAAIEDHYKPVGPSDRVPTDPVAIAVALADKLDMLVGFWAIDEKPTGSKDPYALRRAALGVIRILLENGVRLRLIPLINRHRTTAGFNSDEFEADVAEYRYGSEIILGRAYDVWLFLVDRLKVQLRDQGARHDLVDAVLSIDQFVNVLGISEDLDAAERIKPRGQDDLLLIVRRVEALGKFLESEDGASLLVGYRRAANILRDEEKKAHETYGGAVDAKLLTEPEEKALAAAIDVAIPAATREVGKEDFGAAMAALAKLRAPVDSFFDKVLVNAPDKNVRANRLRLLNRIREATLAVADFSKVGG